MYSIAFEVRPLAKSGGAHEAIPLVDGLPLPEVIHAYEHAAGGIPGPLDDRGGLVSENYRSGPARENWFGLRDVSGRSGEIPVLGCSCGEWGCWPTYATVVFDDETVTWREFSNLDSALPLAQFGPLVFRREDYENAVSLLAPFWDSTQD